MEKKLLILLVVLVVGLIISHLYMIKTLKDSAANVQNQITDIVSGLPNWLGI